MCERKKYFDALREHARQKAHAELSRRSVAGMLALTVYPPWSWALVRGHKPIENRQWIPPKTLGWFWIHAGVTVDQEAFEKVSILSGERPRIVRGAIVGLARCTGAVRRSGGWIWRERGSQRTAEAAVASSWFCGPIGWTIEDAIELEHPVYCRGLQKLWPVPASTLDAALAQIGLGSTANRCSATHAMTRQRCEKEAGHSPLDEHDYGTVHRCHARSCVEPCAPEQLMCPRHWRMVPVELRKEVWKHYRIGQCDDRKPSSGWFDAAEAAIASVAKQEKIKAPQVDEQRQLSLLGGEG